MNELTEELNPENDPIVKLINFNTEEATQEELEAFVTELHMTINDPYEQKALFKGTVKTSKPSAKTKHLKDIKNLLGDL